MIFPDYKIKFTDWWFIILGFTLIVYITGIPVTLMEPDAASYADAAMEMVKRNNFMEIYLRGHDWLDKPHFQFWITAFFYKITGINNSGYKLPAILFSLLGAYYTWLFCKKFYSRKHAYLAPLLLLTSEHLILSSNDVRAELYLSGLTIFSLYYLASYLEEKRLAFLVTGSAGLAGLIMTKGLFTILPVAAGVGLSLGYHRKWKEIFHWQWLLAIVLTLIFISPAIIGYYRQFDLHPEKEIFGQTGVSGVRFFLWDSQWGRFTNTGPIRGQGDPFFFIHTLLWAFAPWAFLACYGIYNQARAIFKKKAGHEDYTLFGFLFVFIIFSISQFQLPHYLVQLFPFLSIIATEGLLSHARQKKLLKVQFVLQVITVIIFSIILILLHTFYFGATIKTDVLIIIVFSISISYILIIREKTWIKKIILPPAIMILAVNYYMNRQFYPDLLHYQSESEVAFYFIKNNLPSGKLICFEKNEWVTDFYLKRIVPAYDEADLKNTNIHNKLVYTTEEGLNILHNQGYLYSKLTSFEDFHVTGLTGKFINKNTRSETLQKTYLVKIL